MALTKTEKALLKKRLAANRKKAARRFVNRNLWRVARILKAGSDGRRDNERARRFRFCLKILEQ